MRDDDPIDDAEDAGPLGGSLLTGALLTQALLSQGASVAEAGPVEPPAPMAGLDAQMTAAEVITHLGLMPHPEGGHFRETFRDVAPDGGRGASTAIYFLLAAGERSHWHRVDAVEIWHWHAGAPLTLEMAQGDARSAVVLGPGLHLGERPQGVVPAFAWQAAESRGAWTLVGCTVAPAFDFAGFELAPPGWSPG